MRDPFVAAGVVFAAVLAAAQPVDIAAQAVQRGIYVSVVDRAGNPVDGLGPSDFIVREDRVAREVLRVAPADDPMQIALLVDNSQAADLYVRDIREGLTAFINGVTADSALKHRIAIITLADRPTINTEYTTDRAQLLKGAQRIFAMSGSGAYLLDGIIETSEGIMRRREPRPTIVTITTEGPELSDRVYQRVLEPLRSSTAAFHAVVLGQPVNTSHDRIIVLAEGTRATGGRYDNILAGTALPAKMKQVAAELTHQYRVTYARPQSLIQPEHITVATTRPGLTARGTPIKPNREPDRPR